jgi:hypothetical protein
MKKILLSHVLLVLVFSASGQGSGIGYMLDIGGSNFSQGNPVYNQSIRTFTHNGFIRFHDRSGKNAVQIVVGYRMDTVSFQNFSSYMSNDGRLLQFNTDAYLKRSAWRIALVNQKQFGRKPGGLMFSLNAGGFYEHTINGSCYDYSEGWKYDLENELNTHNLGVLLGAEMRFGWFTIGCKMEKSFRDVLNHDYILSQELSSDNSSELRGLKMNPVMGFIYLGLNLDFFKEE